MSSARTVEKRVESLTNILALFYTTIGKKKHFKNLNGNFDDVFEEK